MFHTNDIFGLQHKSLGLGIALSFAFSEGKMKFSNTVKIFSIQIPSVQTWSVSSIDSYYSVQNFFSSAKARNAVDYIWL